MKKIHKRTTGIIILAALTAVSLVAQPGQQRNKKCPQVNEAVAGTPGYGPECGVEKGRFADLALTAEQKEQLEALRLEHHKEMKPLRNQMAELRLKKRNLMSEEDADLDEIYSVIDEQTALSNRIQKMSAENRLETRAVFTDEQLMKLEHRRTFAAHRPGKGRHPHGQHRGPYSR